MQSSVQKSTYAYDSQGRLVSRITSGSSNDVISSHVLLDSRVPGPKHISSTFKSEPGETPPTVNDPMGTVTKPISTPLNAPHLYKNATSESSPPTGRHRTSSDLLNPFSGDSGGISTSSPYLQLP